MACQKYAVPLLISLGLISYIPALLAHDEQLIGSNTMPACTSIADDPDGDGVGLAPHFFAEHDCIVTDETAPHPLRVEIDGESRRYSLARNYWDPGADLVNREIECTNYVWSDDSDNFEIEDVFFITHYPLADVDPGIGEYEIRLTINDQTHLGSGMWRSTDGRYLSESYFVSVEKSLQMFADPWGESIQFQDQQGMRFWNMNLELGQDDKTVIVGAETQECKYTSGESFQPTGHWDEAPTDSVYLVGIVPQQVIDIVPVKPEIINPQTGALVELQQLSWDLQEDLFQKKVWCSYYNWFSDSFDPVYLKPDGYLFMPPLPGESQGNLYVENQEQGVYTEHEWFIKDGKFRTTSYFPAEGWYEAVASADEDIRVWTHNAYVACALDAEYVGQKLTPTGAAKEQTSTDGEVQQISTECTDGSGCVDSSGSTDSSGTTGSSGNSESPDNTGSLESGENTGATGNIQPGGSSRSEPAQLISSGGGSASLLLLALLVSGFRKSDLS